MQLQPRILTRSSAGARCAAGFTLLELLLVMGLVGLIMGLGLGLMIGLDPGDRASVGLVENVLRSANNSAIARSAPARVRIDRKEGSFVAEGMAVVGTWRFETPELDGAFGLDGLVQGATVVPLVDDGYQGRALAFAGTRAGVGVTFPVTDDPAFDLRDGFEVRVAVKAGGGGEARLIDIGGSVTISVDRDLAVEAAFVAEAVAATGEASRGSRIRLETAKAALRTDRWTRLVVVYDRRTLSIFTDGIERARRPESARVWKLEGPLVIGGGATSFNGSIDDLVVGAVVASEVYQLPNDVSFGAEAPDMILFGAGGGLDPTAHAGPVLVPLDFVDGARVTIRVGVYGAVE